MAHVESHGRKDFRVRDSNGQMKGQFRIREDARQRKMEQSGQKVDLSQTRARTAYSSRAKSMNE